MSGPKIAALKEPSPRALAFAAADARMQSAKASFGRAAAACLAQRPEAEAMVGAALLAVEQARAQLAALADADVDEQAHAEAVRLHVPR